MNICLLLVPFISIFSIEFVVIKILTGFRIRKDFSSIPGKCRHQPERVEVSYFFASAFVLYISVWRASSFVEVKEVLRSTQQIKAISARLADFTAEKQ